MKFWKEKNYKESKKKMLVGDAFQIKQYADQRLSIERCTGIKNKLAPLFTKEEKIVFENWPLRQIFVIGIRKKRLIACLKRLGLLTKYVTIVPSCHGETIDKRTWGLSSSNTLRRGQLGCFESHCRVWRHMIENDVQTALILEDDAALYPNASMCHHLMQVMHDIRQTHWDIVCLGRSFVKCLNGAPIRNWLVVSGDFYGLFAYVVSREAAIKILMLSDVQQFSLPIDSLLSSLGISGYLKILACEPAVCDIIANSSSDTTRII